MPSSGNECRYPQYVVPKMRQMWWPRWSGSCDLRFLSRPRACSVQETWAGSTTSKQDETRQSKAAKRLHSDTADRRDGQGRRAFARKVISPRSLPLRNVLRCTACGSRRGAPSNSTEIHQPTRRSCKHRWSGLTLALLDVTSRKRN